MKRVVVQSAAFDAGAELALLSVLGGGGVASFVGIVRGEGGLLALEIEHYPGMTENALMAVAAEAETRWPLLGLTIIHRVGRLAMGDPIVLVGVASRHRAAALDACAFLIDRLKTEAPFWKKQHFGDGRSDWVEFRDSDEVAASRWG